MPVLDKASSTGRSTYSAGTGWQDKATLTFTPGSQGDYLILASAILDGSSSTYDSKIRLDVDGSAQYNTANLEAIASGNRIPWGIIKKLTLTAASHTIKIQYATENTSNTVGIAYAYVIALRLSDFPGSDYDEYDTRETHTGDTNWTDTQASIAKTLESGIDYVVIATSGGDISSTNYSVYQQLLQDSTSLGESPVETKDTSNLHIPYGCCKFVTGAGSSVTHKLQYKTSSSSGTAGVQDARIVILQVEAGATYKDFAGTAALTTTTPDATLRRYADFSGAAALTTTTPNASLLRDAYFSGTAALTTSTPNANLSRYADFSGTAALATTTPDADLNVVVYRDFSGTAALSTSTPDATLGRYADFAGTATIQSTTDVSSGNNFTEDSDCKALWRFENNLTDSIGNNDLTANAGGVGYTSASPIEGSFSLDLEKDSNQGASISDGNLDSGFPLKYGDTSKKFSACIWIKPESTPDTDCVVVAKEATGKLSISLDMYSGSGRGGWFSIGWGYAGGILSEWWQNIVQFTAGNTYHLALVVDGIAKSAKLRIWNGTSSTNTYIQFV